MKQTQNIKANQGLFINDCKNSVDKALYRAQIRLSANADLKGVRRFPIQIAGGSNNRRNSLEDHSSLQIVLTI